MADAVSSVPPVTGVPPKARAAKPLASPTAKPLASPTARPLASPAPTPIEPPAEAVKPFPWPGPRTDAALGTAARECSESSLRRDAVFRRTLVLADMAAATLAVMMMVVVGRALAARPESLAGLALAVVAAKLLGLYDRDELVFHKSTLDELPLLFHLATLYALLIWLLHGQVLDGPVGRADVLLFWGVFLCSDGLLRLGARRLARRFAPPERCLIVGHSSARVRLATKLAQTHSRMQIVGSLPLNEERRLAERRRWSRGTDRRRRNLHIGDLDAIVREADIHRVIIIPGSADAEEMLDSIGRAKALGVKVSIVPRLFEVVGSSVEFDDLEGLTVLGLRRFGLTRSSRALKRTLDVVLAAAMLVPLAPLLALIALLIRLDSRGPVLFRQSRVGRNGRVFEMLKFRTMTDGAEAEREALLHLNETQGLFKLSRDPRVTRVGRVLRRLALDELPQIVNVLRGDMSLVGPRPLVVDEDRKVAGRHRGRLRLVPGITGPWQLLGPTRVPLNEMVTIDYLYGANWSLWNDIKILVRTVAYVMHRRGL